MRDWGFATRYDDVSSQVALAGVGEAEQTSASGRFVNGSPHTTHGRTRSGCSSR